MTTVTAIKIGVAALGVKLALGVAVAGWVLYQRRAAQAGRTEERSGPTGCA